MFCTHCGSALEDGARFCGHCGAPAGSDGVVATGGPDDAVRERLAAGDKIGAIKLYREATGLGLAEAKAAVETIESGGRIGFSPPASMAPVALGASAAAGFDDRIRALLLQGDKLGAIKLYRQETGLGLREAKGAVESVAAGLPPGAVSASSTAGRGLTCLGCVLLLVLAGAGLLALFQIPIRMSGCYAQAIELARNNSQVRDTLGEPIAVFPIVWTGRLSSGSDGWVAAYDVRLSGPKASGWLKVRATTRDGFQQTHWNQFSRVEATVAGKRVEIPLR